MTGRNYGMYKAPRNTSVQEWCGAYWENQPAQMGEYLCTTQRMKGEGKSNETFLGAEKWTLELENREYLNYEKTGEKERN